MILVVEVNNNEKRIESFNEKNPDAEIGAQTGGSGTGLTQVLGGIVDIENSDVYAEEKLDAAKAKELVDYKVVAQGFGVVVSKALGIAKSFIEFVTSEDNSSNIESLGFISATEMKVK